MIRARIGGLEVRGFRRFQRPVEFVFRGADDMPPSTLVVAGPNGCGKSSFLEAILYALGREHLLHRQLQSQHRLRWLRAALSADMQVKVSLFVSSAPGTMLGARTPCRVEVTRSSAGWQLSEEGEAKPISDDQEVISSLLADLPIQWFSSWRQSYLCGPVVPMAPADEIWTTESGRLWQVKQRIVDERARSAFLPGNGVDGEWLSRLGEAWAALRGDDGTTFDLAVDAEDRDRRHVDLNLLRRDEELGDLVVCSVDQLSAGELEWIALAGTLVTTNADGIVIVDEPELHLHPEWQTRLLPALRIVAPDAQLVMATHADPPWDQVYSFERLLLVPSGDPREDIDK